MENFDQILDAPATEEVRLHYAGFWVRVGAYIVDAIVLLIPNVLLRFVLPLGGLEVELLLLAIGVAYFAFMESSANQGTLGKMAVGIKVGDSTGGQISALNAIGRYFAKLLSAVILCIGFIMVGFDEKNQGLHDKLANTFVFYGR